MTMHVKSRCYSLDTIIKEVDRYSLSYTSGLIVDQNAVFQKDVAWCMEGIPSKGAVALGQSLGDAGGLDDGIVLQSKPLIITCGGKVLSFPNCEFSYPHIQIESSRHTFFNVEELERLFE